MRSNGTVALIVGARCAVEAVAFTAIAAIVHAGTAGRDPLPVLPTAFAVYGVSLLLAAFLREARTERRGSLFIVLTLAAAAAWGLSLPMHARADGLSTLSRIVGFALIGEALLWRLLSVARGATRWTDARNAFLFGAVAVGVAALAPGPIDRASFAPLALLAIVSAAVALSLARSAEELALSRGTTGAVRASSATSATLLVGAASIVTALLMPGAQSLLAAFGERIGPAVDRLVYLLLLPIAYLAGYIVELLRPLIRDRKLELPAALASTPEQDAEMLRQMEQIRPVIFGGFELLIVAAAALVAIVLLERMLRERRLDLPAGVELERAAVSGIGLRDTFAALRPRRARRRRAPADDGSAGAAVRVAYWRLLSLAERRGAGWREDAETPAEHHARLVAGDGGWREAAVVVRAFEDVRYGDVDPDAATVARARDAVRALEARPRAS